MEKEILENVECDNSSEGEAVCDSSELENKLAELNDKYLRTLAELENTRRRASVDAAAAARTRAVSMAENFLPLIDAIEAALKHNPENQDFISFAKAADGALESAGIKKIETLGQPLNPALHNAIQTEQSDAPAGTITQEFQPGYMLGDAVLRPAMVIVSQ
jgi:molecular chaperone GrpE